MSISEITNQLVVDRHGIYLDKTVRKVSYPESGNRDCFLLEDSSFWFQHRNQCITKVIELFPPGGPIVDIGGGNGFVTRGILDAGFEAILLEPGPEGAMNGKLEREIPTVICSTFQDAGFKDSSLHAVGCFDVIEHIERDKEFIKQTNQALKPGGLLYATVPAHHLLWSQSDVTAQHYRRYNKSMIHQLLDDYFEIQYFTYFFSILTVPIFVFRAVPFRLGFSRGESMLSRETEHGVGRGFGIKLLNQRLNGELKKIARGKTLRFGASCLIVARKR